MFLINLTKSDLPEITLPGGAKRISDTAQEVGTLMAKTEKFFVRGNVLTMLQKNDDSKYTLESVKASAMTSELESVANLLKIRKDELVPTTCNESQAKLILHSRAFQDSLPPINL